MTLSDSGRHFRYKTARSNTLALAGGFFTTSATWEALECATDTLDLFQIYKFSSLQNIQQRTCIYNDVSQPLSPFSPPQSLFRHFPP